MTQDEIEERAYRMIWALVAVAAAALFGVALASGNHETAILAGVAGVSGGLIATGVVGVLPRI